MLEGIELQRVVHEKTRTIRRACHGIDNVAHAIVNGNMSRREASKLVHQQVELIVSVLRSLDE